MKVVFYSTSAEDIFRYRLPVARRLRVAGYSVVFAGPSGEFAARTAQEGFTYRRTSDSLENTGPLSDVTAGIRLSGIYRNERPDIVHHYTLRGLVSGAIAARLAPVSWVVQSVPPLLQKVRASRLLRAAGRPVLRFALKNAEVTFRSHNDRQFILSKGCGRPERTHILSGTGIEVTSYPFREEPDRTPVVAMIGPLQDEDAVETFADAARRVRSQEPAARFVLIGTRPDAPAVPRPTLNRWMEEGIVEWWGPRRDIADVLAKIHVLCAVEQVGREIPHLLLEAAACGRPIVAVESPTSLPIVRDGETGRLVRARLPDALEEAFLDLLRDGERRRCLGKNIRRLVESEFSADRVAKQTMLVYERLFERGREI